MKRMLAIFGLALIGFFNAAAQDRTLTGVVRDTENKGLPGATVLFSISDKPVVSYSLQ